MSKKDNFKFPFEQFHAQLEQIGKLYTSPLIDTVTQQQALLRSFEQPLAAFEKSQLPFEQFRAQSEEIGTLFSSPVIEIAQQQQNIYNNLVADAFTGFHESIGSLNIQPIFHDDAITAALGKTIKPIQRMVNNYSKSIGLQFKDIINTSTAALIEESFSPFIESLTTQNYENINEQCILGLKPLFDVLDDIEVVDDHVEISDTPISRHFFNGDDLTPSASGKLNWDFNKVMAFLCFVISILGWLFPDPLSHLSDNATSDNPGIVLTSEQSNVILEHLSTVAMNTEIIVQNMNQTPTASSSDLPLSTIQPDTPDKSSVEEPDHEDSCTCCNTPQPSTTE